jgi:hypothetical protein
MPLRFGPRWMDSTLSVISFDRPQPCVPSDSLLLPMTAIRSLRASPAGRPEMLIWASQLLTIRPMFHEDRWVVVNSTA